MPVRPAVAEEGLENPCSCRLADRHRAGDANDERHLLPRVAEKGVGDAEQVLAGGDMEAEKPGQRDIDVRHLVERHSLVDPTQLIEICLGERDR